MMNAILAALNDATQNMLLTLLLFSLLIIWLQSRLHKDFNALRKEIAEGDAESRKQTAEGFKALREEIADGNVSLRKEIKEIAERTANLQEGVQGVSVRLARIEGALGLPAPVPDAQPAAKAG